MPAVRGKLKFDRFMTLYRKEIENELLALAEHLSGLIQKRAPVGATGNLSGSYEGRLVEIPNGVRVEVGSPSSYGAYVEFDTKPHWVPIKPLIQWVEAKIQPHVLAVGVSFESGRAVPTRKGTKKLRGDKRARAISALAHAVQFKIAHEGTKGQYFMRDSIIEMGLGYNVEPEKGQYNIDVAGWLENRMPAIIARAAKRLT